MKSSVFPKEPLDWLRFVLNPETVMPAVTDWPALFAFAKKQALIGLFLPGKCPDSLSEDDLLPWLAPVHMIERKNKQINQRVEQLVDLFEQDGFSCCILKGQGNAAMYPNPLRRSPGDIDVWIDSDEATVYQYVHKLFPKEKASFKHIHFPLFKDVRVDVHVTPLKFFSKNHSKHFQQWIGQNRAEQFAHWIRLPGTSRDICVPTGKFNSVYQLGHMLLHLFDKGLGLRQVVDYFYVLKALDLTEKDREELAETLKSLGMLRFAAAMMWVERDVLGLPDGQCIVGPDKRLGKILLGELIAGGNFGEQHRRKKGKGRFFFNGLVNTRRNLALLPLAPREDAARLCHKIKTLVKRVFKA